MNIVDYDEKVFMLTRPMDKWIQLSGHCVNDLNFYLNTLQIASPRSRV